MGAKKAKGKKKNGGSAKTQAARLRPTLERPSEAAARYEREHFPDIGLRARLTAALVLVLLSAAWMLSAEPLFTQSGLGPDVQLASFYFACLACLYVLRCMLESRRRYGTVTVKSCFYYSQTSIYAQKRCLYIFLVAFGAATLGRWLVPSPNRSPTCMDMVGCYYLAYIHSTYYHKEQIPYRWTETLFLLLTYFTPYLVYAMGRMGS